MILSYTEQLDALPPNAELAAVGYGPYFKTYDGTYRRGISKETIGVVTMTHYRPYLVEATLYDPADLNKLLPGAVLLGGPHVMQLSVVDTRRFWTAEGKDTIYPERYLPARLLDPGFPRRP